MLVIHHDAEQALKEIDVYFNMNDMTIENGVECWGLSSSKYVQEAVKNAEECCRANYGIGLPKKAPTPYPKNYRPEIDLPDELIPTEASYFHSAIGILRWIVELGRIDIITEVSLLSSHLALPRRGHLEVVFRIFAYLRDNHNAGM